jgi:HK97 family phage major capsid protein
MSIELTTTQSLALRKTAVPLLRRLGVKTLDDYESHKLDWQTLNEHAGEVLKAARAKIEEIKDGMPEAELAEIENAHAAMLAIHDDIESEKDFRTQIGSRSPRAHGGDPRRPLYEDRTVNPNGAVAEEPETVGLKPEQRMVDHVARMGNHGDIGVTTGAFLRALILGARNDAEKRALSEGTPGAGGYTVPDVLSARLIDKLRAASVTIRAGALTVPLTSDTNYVARVLTDPEPAWRSEAGPVGDSGPTFDRITFTPRSLAVLVKVSRELLEDSLNIETALPNIIAEAMAREVDRVALFGSGTPPEPKGVVNFSDIQTIALNAAITNYSPLVKARTKIRNANAPGASAFIMHTEDEGAFADLRESTTGQPLNVPPAIAQVPILSTTAVPGDLTASPPDDTQIVTGWFPYLLIGMRSQLRIEVLKERYADNMQYGFLAHLRMDVAAEHENAFVKITGIPH